MDSKTRELQRAASTGDQEAELHLIRARMREGDLSWAQVKVLAWCEHEVCEQLVYPVPQEFQDHIAGVCHCSRCTFLNGGFEAWVSCLVDRGGDLEFEGYQECICGQIGSGPEVVEILCGFCKNNGKIPWDGKRRTALVAATAAAWVACVRNEARRGWVAKVVKRRKQRGYAVKLVPHNQGLINRIKGDVSQEDKAPREVLEALEEFLISGTLKDRALWDERVKGIKNREAAEYLWLPDLYAPGHYTQDATLSAEDTSPEEVRDAICERMISDLLAT